MRTTLLAASLALLTACGGAIAPTPGDPNGQGPSGGQPGATNPGGSGGTNPGAGNPGGNPTQPQPAQPGDPAATASVTGSVNGAPFTFSSVTAMRQSGTRATGGYVFVMLSNRAFSCAELQDASTKNETFANLNVLMVGVAAVEDATVVSGTFPIGSTGNGTQEGLAIVESSDATCNYKQSQAQAGSITFDTLTADQVSGEFRADFGGGQQLTGSFAVPVCDLGVPNDAQSGTPACLP